MTESTFVVKNKTVEVALRVERLFGIVVHKQMVHDWALKDWFDWIEFVLGEGESLEMCFVLCEHIVPVDGDCLHQPICFA